MESFLVALNAVVPFTFYIAFGYLMQRVHAVEEDFLKKLNQMVFHLFPAWVLSIDGSLVGVKIGKLTHRRLFRYR